MAIFAAAYFVSLELLRRDVVAFTDELGPQLRQQEEHIAELEAINLDHGRRWNRVSQQLEQILASHADIVARRRLIETQTERLGGDAQRFAADLQREQQAHLRTINTLREQNALYLEAVEIIDRYEEIIDGAIERHRTQQPESADLTEES